MDFNHLVCEAESFLEQSVFKNVEKIEMKHTTKILNLYAKHQVASRHFSPTTGYGYDDVGRDTLERIFADLFDTQSAIVRPQIASGTHAIALCLFGLALPNQHILSVTGKPYDTLDDVLGLNELVPGSLKELNIDFSFIDLNENGEIDLDNVIKNICKNTTVVMVQRSCGYSWRKSLKPKDISKLSELLKSNYPHITLMVDNCYGEFVCEAEPSHFGADVCVGSLIKNPGGGIAPTGAYIVGTNRAIERISSRLTAPGIGKEVGSYAASYQPFYQGLFLAPHTVAQAIKTSALTAKVFEMLSIKTAPASTDERTDIIQAIEMQTPERLISFCQGIQMASPIDSMALPEPWDMPGYQHQVIMAAGTFVSGASIELSADAPMRKPYILYMQGGLTYCHGKIALIRALERMKEMNCL